MSLASSQTQSLETAFRRDHPGYADTGVLDELRRSDFARLDRGGHVYLDYTGGGLYAESQLREHMRLLENDVFGNPHSINPTSAASTELVERARASVLEFFNASPEETSRFSPRTPLARCGSSARRTRFTPETDSCSPSTTTTPSTGSASSPARAAPRPRTCQAWRPICASTRTCSRAT